MKRTKQSARATLPLDAALPAEAAAAEDSSATIASGGAPGAPGAPNKREEPSLGDGLAALPVGAAARLIRLDEGFYAIGLGPLAGLADARDGMSLPAAHFSAPPPFAQGPVTIIAASDDRGPWLGAEGGTVVVRAPAGGGAVLVTLYGTAAPAAVEIGVEPLFARPLFAPPGRLAAAPAAPREAGHGQFDSRALPPAAIPEASAATPGVPIEISVHIEQVGDRRMPGDGWVGTRGERLQLEAFGLTPLGELAPADIEYMAFGPAGRQTPWASEGRLVGSRGRAIPLMGIAVRVNPALSGRFEALYRGAFFSGAVVGPCRDGEPCLSPNADDPLEAIDIAIHERGIG